METARSQDGDVIAIKFIRFVGHETKTDWRRIERYDQVLSARDPINRAGKSRIMAGLVDDGSSDAGDDVPVSLTSISWKPVAV